MKGNGRIGQERRGREDKERKEKKGKGRKDGIRSDREGGGGDQMETARKERRADGVR